MDRSTWERLADRLELAWPEHGFNEDQRALYFEVLGDLEDEQMTAAVERLIREDRSTVPPPGVLRARALEVQTATPTAPSPVSQRGVQATAPLPPLGIDASRTPAAPIGAQPGPEDGREKRALVPWMIGAGAAVVIIAAALGALVLSGGDGDGTPSAGERDPRQNDTLRRACEDERYIAAYPDVCAELGVTSADGEQAARTETPAAADPPARPVRVTRRLDYIHAGATRGRCFGPRAGASFTISGIRRTSDFLNCGSEDDPTLASGAYTFEPLPEGTIKFFTATFAIDEGSFDAQAGSSADFVVSYGPYLICEVTARWRSPTTCAKRSLDIPTSAGRLTIEQDVAPASYRAGDGLWAGLAYGRIAVNTASP